MKKHNFSAGPAILPQSVIQKASEGVIDIHGSTLSILEVSHRGPEVSAIADEAESLLRELYGIPDTYAVLFLAGGASSQFFMAPMNLLNSGESADYIETGAWSAKAIKEAKLFGDIQVIASSKAENYNHIPADYQVNSDSKYLHITTNNTIFGTQYASIPSPGIPLVADSSSDFLSRPIQIEDYAVLYGGAQKNLGPAGVTVVIVRKDMLGKVERAIPTMLNYQTHIEKGSMFNTPPVFPIYVSLLTMRWLKEQGGLSAIQAKNQAKAELLYQEIDRNSLFEGTAAVKDRSVMNVTFVPKDEGHTQSFLDLCVEADISGIKGHRSVGGFRASMYNAMDIASVEAVVQVMQAFEENHA